MSLTSIGWTVLRFLAEREVSGRSAMRILRELGERFTDEVFWREWRREVGYVKGFYQLRRWNPYEQLKRELLRPVKWTMQGKYKIDYWIRKYNRITGQIERVMRSYVTDKLDTPANMGTRLVNDLQRAYGAKEPDVEWEWEGIAAGYYAEGEEEW